MKRATFVLLFFALILAGSFVAACGSGGGTTGTSGGLSCTNGCYCAGYCGTLYKCSTGICNDTFCCCPSGSCSACGCF